MGYSLLTSSSRFKLKGCLSDIDHMPGLLCWDVRFKRMDGLVTEHAAGTRRGSERDVRRVVRAVEAGEERGVAAHRQPGAYTRSTFRLNVRTICWIRWVHYFPPAY
jgi:hypothetical protein